MKKEIKQRLEEAYNYLTKDFGYKVAYIGVYGSQNYKLETDFSDIDMMAYIIPSFDNLFFEKKVSKEYKFKNGKIIVRDIRTISHFVKKMNPVDMEVFITENYIVKDFELITEIFYLRYLIQKIVQEHMDIMFFEAICTMHNLYTSHSSSLISNKKIANILRYKELLGAIRLCTKKDLKIDKMFYWVPKREEIIGIKTGKISLEEAQNRINEVMQIVTDKTFYDDALSKKIKAQKELYSNEHFKELENTIYRAVKEITIFSKQYIS